MNTWCLHKFYERASFHLIASIVALDDVAEPPPPHEHTSSAKKFKAKFISQKRNDLFGIENKRKMCSVSIVPSILNGSFISWRAARSQWVAIKSIIQKHKNRKSQIFNRQQESAKKKTIWK